MPANGSMPSADFGEPVIVPCQQEKTLDSILYPEPPEANILERFPSRMELNVLGVRCLEKWPVWTHPLLRDPESGPGQVYCFFPTSQEKVRALS